MDSLLDFIRRLRDVQGLIAWGGYVGMTFIVFAETGLLVGFFLPGDSLIVTAGLLAATTGMLNVYLLGLLLTLASIIGNMAGYAIGAATGPRLFTRENSLLFNKKHLNRAHAFYEKHGGRTIILARFMPIVRTFVPVVAGIAQMEYRQYMRYNVIGGVAWIWSMLFIGYFLGRYIPGVDKHIETVILLVIFVSLLPGIISWWRHRGTPQDTSDPASK
jgi:membrane-associated protein